MTSIPRESQWIMPCKSDTEILNLLSKNHFPHEGAKPSFDVKGLLEVTGEIITYATDNKILDNILQPSSAVHSPTAQKGYDNFTSPLCLLKSISCEMSSCNSTGTCDFEEISLDSRTEAILVKLKYFSWEAKAVLALSAFALEYGDFWRFVQLFAQGDQLARSVAILKGVPVLIKPETLKKRKATVEVLNEGINKTKLVIESIMKVVDALMVDNDPTDVPTLDTEIENIPIHIYWIIATIVACASQVNRLTSNQEEPYVLSGLVEKIEAIRQTLTGQYHKRVKEKEVVQNYRKIRRQLVKSEDITKVISVLIVSDYNEMQKTIIFDGSTKQKVDSTRLLTVLKGKYVLFYISKVNNVSKADISSLLKVHKEHANYNFEIMWIPIVEEWTTEAELQYEKWRAQMPWYAVKYLSSASRRYLEKKWKCRGNPTAVLFNRQGKLESRNALVLIKKYAINFFDFVDVKVEKLLEPVVRDIKGIPHLQDWIEKPKPKEYVLFYGGTDDQVYQEFSELIRSTVVAIKSQKDISIMLADIGITDKGGNDERESKGESFWSGMENTLVSLNVDGHEEKYKSAAKQVQKLISLRKESAWAMLSRGSTLVTCGHAEQVSSTLKDFSTWMKKINEDTDGKSFGWKFKKQLTKISSSNAEFLPKCCSFEIAGGNAPLNLDCPFCNDPMDTELVRYTCCHPSLHRSIN